MRDRIKSIVGDKDIYKTRQSEFKTEEKIPFRVSDLPLSLGPEERRELENIGRDIVAYFKAVDELYVTDARVRTILNTGKPDLFLFEKPVKYLFIRPDIVITKDGFRICEIETSPFGLALAEILNKAYREAGFETLVTDTALSTLVRAHTPTDGTIIYSNKTATFSGQLDFLAESVFSSDSRRWFASHANIAASTKNENIYRGFYLSEYYDDLMIASLLQEQIKDGKSTLPSITPHLEEKAILAFIWDKRFEEYFIRQLGRAASANLRKAIPPNWIVGQEKHFAPGLPNNMESSIGLASLSSAKRAFVLKTSGFSSSSSWAEGVNFLHKKSKSGVERLLRIAEQDKMTLYVIQEFTQGVIRPMEYTDEQGNRIPMRAKVRLTPYFSVESGNEGQLVAIKATARERTDYIHAASDSINTAVN